MTSSVVIAWVNPLELLEPGLRALIQKSTVKPDEIIVATRVDAAEQARFRAAFPRARLLSAAPHATIPQLRALGIRASVGAAVFVTEDHCIPAPDWIERGVRVIEGGAGIAGGPVENACTSRLRDWAAFLTDYSGVIRPAAGDVINAIPGNNMACRRDAAEEIAATLEADLWESFVFAELRRGGVRMEFDRDMLVYHRRPFGIRYFIGQRYYFCRSFAAMRCRKLGRSGRLKYAAGTLALPLLLPARAFGNLLLRGRLIGRFLLCSPLIFAYFAAGAMGELAGYLRGAGTSLQHVE